MQLAVWILACLLELCQLYFAFGQSSCKDIYLADNRTPSGNKVIYHNNQAITVYCSFEGSYGYTYISKTSYNAAVNIDLLYSTRSFAKIRIQRPSGEQSEVIVENLPSYQSASTLFFGFNNVGSYQGPIGDNVAMRPFIFLGYLPISLVANRNTQGYRAGGVDYTFANCDSNPNSYLTFYYNPNNVAAGNIGYTNAFMEGWITQSSALSTQKYMDSQFYFDWEMHMGGCGGLTTSQYLSNIRASLGLPFAIQPCDGVNCKNGGNCVIVNSVGTCSCVGTYFGDRCENVNGAWTLWTGWNTCSKTCGGGSQSRTRSCTNPSPMGTGSTCSGSSSENQNCNTDFCPINGGWSVWTQWSSCPSTCSGENLSRTRTCTNPAPQYNGLPCTGALEDTMSCYTAKCPVNGGWNDWSQWSACPTTCAGENLSRTRICTNPAPLNNGLPCPGSSVDTMSCYTAKCPVNGQWTDWSQWSQCPLTCAGETLSRTRSCSNPAPLNGGLTCSGNNLDTISCLAAKCPVNGGWADWSEWSDCPTTCSGENLSRTRTCSNPSPLNGGLECPGTAFETMSCYTAKCPVNGVWSDWSQWSQCPLTCAGETLSRTRYCANPAPLNGGLTCSGNDLDTISCLAAKCPVNGGWADWSGWSDCPTTCSGENLSRTRTCSSPTPLNAGLDCAGAAVETMSCYTAKCPVNGVWSDWSQWSKCPTTCAGESLSRIRTCTNPAPLNGGIACSGEDSDTMSCFTAKCPVNGGWSDWSVWSNCPATCQGEDLSRTRTCSNPAPQNAGIDCPDSSVDTMSCYTAKCPVNGGWSDWSSWSQCPITCSNENLSRARTCSNPTPQNDGLQCIGSKMDTIPCLTAKCPVNGAWSIWSEWSRCPVTCAAENLNRQRNCTNPEPQNGGVECVGSAEDTMSCLTAKCPVNGVWTGWTLWSSCPGSCNGQNLTRTRTCTNPPTANNGTACSGDGAQSITCLSALCPVNGGWSYWSLWTKCPVTCDGSEQSRNRTCSLPEPLNGGTNCTGASLEYQKCGSTPCLAEAFKSSGITVHNLLKLTSMLTALVIILCLKS